MNKKRLVYHVGFTNRFSYSPRIERKRQLHPSVQHLADTRTIQNGTVLSPVRISLIDIEPANANEMKSLDQRVLHQRVPCSNTKRTCIKKMDDTIQTASYIHLQDLERSLNHGLTIHHSEGTRLHLGWNLPSTVGKLQHQMDSHINLDRNANTGLHTSDMGNSWVASIIVLMGGGSIFVRHLDLPSS